MMRSMRVDRRSRAVLIALTALAASCTQPGKEHTTEERPAVSVQPHADVSASARPAPSAPPRPSAATSASSAPVELAFDAGVNACRLLYGPAQQAFTGEVALAPIDNGVLVVTQHDGIPTVTRVTPDRDAKPVRSTMDTPAPKVSSPPCAVAGAFSLCMDPAGGIHERSLETEGHDIVVAHALPHTHFDAEALESVHVVVAFLAGGHTADGVVSQAYAVLDQQPPVRIAEDGTGTTHVALAQRGSSLIALMLDGRVAMTPMHARSLSVSGGKLALGEDSVVYVGGAAESRTQATLGVSPSGAFGLTGIAGEGGFGMAAVRLDDPPRLDEPTTWSQYVNGLDPAPIAATEGPAPIRVARVRPLEARPNSPRGLELGKLDDAGTFSPYGLVGSQGRVTAATIVADRGGTIWLAYTDSAGTWLERRACP
jgi:hypothetical protein